MATPNGQDAMMRGEAPSIFRFVSLGTAVENKPRGDVMLNVLQNEKAMATDGEIAFNPQTVERQYKDSSGGTHQVKTTQDRSVPCSWLPSEDNRATPPDIMRNEIVEVWRLGDSEQYFWRSMAVKNGLRTLESVVYTWGASPNPGGAGVDFSTCYYMAVSAHDKHFTIGTSTANGEPVRWTLQFNTGEGEFTIQDDIGNEFEIVSRNNLLRLKNPDGTYVKLEQQTIEMSANESIELKVGATSYKLTPDTVSTQTTNIVDKASAITMETSTTVITSPTITFNSSKINIVG